MHAFSLFLAFASCTPDIPDVPDVPVEGPKPGTCTGTWPSSWQDPTPSFAMQWQGQTISNTPAIHNWNPGNPSYTNNPFRLSDAYPRSPVDDAANQSWRDARYDALFVPTTPQEQKTALGKAYIWALMDYIQEGNVSSEVGKDWSLCNNPIRPWFHIPFQTYDVMSGRDFIHGLTREAPVTFSLKNVKNADGTDTLPTVVWAVAHYNATAAHTLGTVWGAGGAATLPSTNRHFAEGSVIGKLLFTTATPEQMPSLTNVPAWVAAVSGFTDGVPSAQPMCSAGSGADMPAQSVACPRTLGTLSLLQFDVAVRDNRAALGWVYGTFVADGEHLSKESPWKRISALGLTWGNDPPAAGSSAANTPTDPRTNGFPSEVVFWDVVDRLNQNNGGAVATQSPGHLGCNLRLNGPADNINSSCLSCHMTGSVPDKNNNTPPIIAQFASMDSPMTQQCVDPATSKDASGQAATEKNGVTFAQMDGAYFGNTTCGIPMDFDIAGTSVLTGMPVYAGGATKWVATDYSMQLSISMVQWQEWQQHRSTDASTPRVLDSKLPRRGE